MFWLGGLAVLIIGLAVFAVHSYGESKAHKVRHDWAQVGSSKHDVGVKSSEPGSKQPQRTDAETDKQRTESLQQNSSSHRAANELPRPLPSGPPLKQHSDPIPILMYHVIKHPPAGAPYPDLFVPADLFTSQMEALAKDGYTAVTLDQSYSDWERGVRLPDKPIVLTFDDGYHSVYKNALPVLRKLRWPGVLKLAVKNLKVEGGLSSSHVKELIGSGWELGAHTVTHPDLTTVDGQRLREEIAGSRTELKKRFGVPVNFFCYPWF